ncbi:MAG: hypothetical protein IJT19_06775 [Bacteroidaceae bacterium]|nr:hypothetical protein [Bacteroidaceae bacterium]
MKKTYIEPNTRLVVIHSIHMMAESIGVNSKQLTGTSAGWAREDNSWDIWGGGDDEE